MTGKMQSTGMVLCFLLLILTISPFLSANVCLDLRESKAVDSTRILSDRPQAGSQTESRPSSTMYVKGELLVKLHSSTDTQIVSLNSRSDSETTWLLNSGFAVHRIERLSITNDIAGSEVYRLLLSKDTDIELTAEQYRRSPLVEWAEPNYKNYVCTAPNDFYYDRQWALQAMQTEQAWDIETGNRNVTIAIIDTGVQWNHPDLAGNIWNNTDEILDGVDNDGNGFIDDIRGWDFVNTTDPVWPGEDGTVPDNDPMDFFGHGTHCAGIAGAVANNSIGIAGVSLGCTIMPVRAGYKAADGQGVLEDLDCAAAIYYAADNGAKIISMSWGSDEPSDIIKTALDYASQKGLVLVAAAGNDNGPRKLYPAAYDNVISVAATTSDDSRSIFSVGGSNYGSWIDIAAPGGGLSSPYQIWSTILGSSYGPMSGTSMAAPHVAGVAGLVLSRNSTFTSEEVRNILRSTADPIQAGPIGKLYIGTGRVSAFKALQRNSTLLAALEPYLDDILVKEKVTVNGTVEGATEISRVELSYGSGFYPETWTTIADWSNLAAGSHPVSTSWDVSMLVDGKYSLRLQAFETSGQATEDRANVNVDKRLQGGFPASIGDVSDTSPVVVDLDQDGEREIVVGSGDGKIYTFRSDGTSFPGWPKELDPVPPDQLSYVGATSSAVADVDNDGQLEIVAKSGGDLHVLKTNGSYLDGWPQSMGIYRYIPRSKAPWSAMDLRSSPVVADIENDGSFEIIAGHDDELFAFRHNGSKVSGWPVYLGDSATVWGSPAVADIDKDGFREIVFQTGFANASIWVLRHDGTNMSGWPRVSMYTSCAASPVLGDINNDGNVEIVTGSGITGSEGVRVFAWHNNGSLLKGWPFGFTVDWYIGEIDGLSLGNVDGDNKLEIVASCSGLGPDSVYVLNSEGVPLPNWPQSMLLGHRLSSPAIGDVDGDGENDVIVGTGGNTASSDGMIYAWHSEGTLISGWPKLTYGGIHSSPAISDLNNDGKQEVAVTSEDGMVYVWDTDGLSSLLQEWPAYMHDTLHSSAYSLAETRDIKIAKVELQDETVYAGQTALIFVKVENLGNLEETFNVTAFCNATSIGVQRITLQKNDTAKLTFPWDTANAPLGVYPVSASLNELFGELNVTNNYFSDGELNIALDNATPVILPPWQFPEAVQPFQEVEVLVNVFDYETGVTGVMLSFKTGSSEAWTSVTMSSFGNGTYLGRIQGQENGVLVKYIITAFDKAGNSAVDDNAGSYFIYTVTPELSISVMLALFLSMSLFTVIMQLHRRHSKPN